MLNDFFQDFSANRGNVKGQFVLAFFRLAYRIRRCGYLGLVLGFPILAVYRILVEWVLGIELPWKTKVGRGLRLYHGVALVVNDRAVIGKDVVLRHSTTIGVRGTFALGEGLAPVIEDGVDIGCHVVILGAVKVGAGAKIGAGSVVLSDVRAGATVVGSPAREIGIV